MEKVRRCFDFQEGLLDNVIEIMTCWEEKASTECLWGPLEAYIIILNNHT